MDKTPGVDGFSVKLFTKKWSIIKSDMYNAIHEFFFTGSMDQT